MDPTPENTTFTPNPPVDTVTTAALSTPVVNQSQSVTTSPAFSLASFDWKHVGMVFLYGVLALAFTTFEQSFTQINFGDYSQYASLANMALVALANRYLNTTVA